MFFYDDNKNDGANIDGSAGASNVTNSLFFPSNVTDTRETTSNDLRATTTSTITSTAAAEESSEASEDQFGRTNEMPKLSQPRRIVVVGFGMVGQAFIEKLMKFDAKRHEYEIIIIGEEPHLAYNRVGLTSYFQHRKVKNLYLNSQEWYSTSSGGSLTYYTNTLVTEILQNQKLIKTATGMAIHYDDLVLSTGSDAMRPSHTPGHNSKGVFVYRTIKDLETLIKFSATKTGTVGVVVGGGLLGLEAAKAMMDLEEFKSVKLIERNRWVLSRQLDAEAGNMVIEQVRALGLDVRLSKQVQKINVDENDEVCGIIFEDGEEMECSCICFAIGIKARDDLARKSGIKCAERGGGIVVGADLMTSAPDVYAIGECANWENQTFGLIAPGVEMADVLAFNLTQAKAHSLRRFKRPDLSTKLKLLGVEVASFGDFFADRNGPTNFPKGFNINTAVKEKLQDENKSSLVKALTFKDPFRQVYKKYLFTSDGKYLLGGMMIGDTTDYVKLVPMVKNQKQLEALPSELMVGSRGDDDPDDLPNDTQICSCHNVTKEDICISIKNKTCKSIGDVKSCTKAGTGCGGCMPLVQTIFNKTMASMGQEIKNHLCPHFEYSRADLFNIVSVKQLTTFSDIMRECGKDAESLGCEACKPAIGSILSSLFNKYLVDTPRRGLQDTNDKFLANIQRNGTFSIVPRMPGGEVTPEKLIIIGNVAKKYNLYTKITGGQRIDLFGARKQDLVTIWTELVKGGMESGHAYAKSLRTVKSCVGSTWCRFGIGDSVGMAVRLEERYKSIRAPHKLKGGVSGCVRECAEAQSKDFGLIATDKGFNVFVGGNGGAKPRHSELLAKDVAPDDVVQILDRYLSFYIRTADKLQRTARWIEGLPGGIKYLREVILEDKLGICADLERQMEDLVSSYFCEWTETIGNADRRRYFEQFANTNENVVDTIEPITERGQQRPADWPDEAVTTDFRGVQWTNLAWQPLVLAEKFADMATGNGQAVKRGDTQLAVFKVKGKWYCTQQMCPHKRAFVLSDGLIGDEPGTDRKWVSCPYHKRNFELDGKEAGKCMNGDELSVATFEVEERADGWVYAKLPGVEELDAMLGTERWKIRAGEGGKGGKKLAGEKGRRGRRAAEGTTSTGAVEGMDW